MLAVTVMFSCSGVNKAKFLEYVRENPMRYKDWGKEWSIKTDGKEDDLFSPYLDKPFEKAGVAKFVFDDRIYSFSFPSFSKQPIQASSSYQIGSGFSI